MGWWSAHIMGGDTPLDFKGNFNDVLLEKHEEIIGNLSKKKREEILYGDGKFEAKVYNECLEDLIEQTKVWGEDQAIIGLQVLGYMMMEAGAEMPEELKQSILEACDADEWAKEEREDDMPGERCGIIDKFKKQVEAYGNEKVENLEQDPGLFSQIATTLSGEGDAEEIILKAKMQKMLDELKEDERNYSPTATVFANAPLALIQLGLSSKINLLEELLGLPLSKFPLQKQEKTEDQ